MRVLIGYSTCPHTRAAFEKLGHDVWTCDLRPDDHPKHLQCDVWEVVRGAWDPGIFHPTCTYLTCSAAWAFADPDHDRYPHVGYHQRPAESTLTGRDRREARQRAVDDVIALDALPYPTAIENPSPSFLAKFFRRPDQVVQPYQFGDDASKGTGLWLSDLPPLVIDPAKRLPGRIVDHNGKSVERWANQTDSGQNKLGPSAKRWIERSATYPGIAQAMADTWGKR